MTPFIATYLPRLMGRFYPDLLWRMPTRERVAYLTFDDGPTPALTLRLLELLDRFSAKASFFILGEQAVRHPDLLLEIVAQGHTIGNHTYSHPDAWYAPPPQVLAELNRTTALLEEMTGAPIRWMRPPYGRFTRSMRHWCQTHHQRLTMWDVMPGDFMPGITQQHIERLVLRTARPGSIIVLHDNPKAEHTLPAALETILETLSEQGWVFRAL